MTDKPIDTQPQNSDDAATSLNQVVEAKHNSSVAGVVQAHSISNSIINIRVDNRTDKDELPSKTNQNKKLNNLPHRNRFFTGRVDVLNQLADLIKYNQQVAIKQAISGIGGVGKTQTALEFCHLHINSYQTILWVNAENEISFNNSYYGVVDLLNLASSSTSTNDGASYQALKLDEVISLVKRWLANNHNWLMIFDNLEDAKLIKDYLPSNHQGHVLITTQQHDLGVIAKTITLDKMDSNTGSLFLLKRSELLSENDSLDKANPNDLSVAQEIVKEMDGLPLALDQAGAYIRQTQSSLQHYLDLYKDARHAAKLRDKRGKHTDGHISVTATFQLAFDKVKDKSLTASKTLEVCSLLNPDLIPEEIFTNAGNLLSNELTTLVNDPLAWDEVLETLSNYSLIKRNPNNHSFAIHRLVQAVIRELLDLNSQILLLRKLVLALHHLLPAQADTHIAWPVYHKISITTFELVSVAKTISKALFNIFPFQEAAMLFHQVALYCRTQSQFNKSFDLYKEALTIYKTLFGNKHTSVSFTLNNIAALYSSWAKYHEALETILEAFNIYKHNFPNNDCTTANYFNNIGEVYFRLDDYQQASNHYQQAFTIHKQLRNDNHSDFGLLLTNMGLLYLKQNNKNRALESILQALHIHKLHNNLPYLTATLQNLADLYAEEANYNEALRYYKEALEINIAIFGDYNSKIAQNYNNIGTIYIKKENYQEALSYFQKSLNIKKMFFANDHPDIANTLNNIGKAYYQQGNYSLALDYYNQSLTIKKHNFGNNHSSVAMTLENLGHLYKAINKQIEAVDYYKQALAIYDQVFPANHPWVAELLDTYSQLLLNLNKSDEAQPLLDRLASLKQSKQE